MQALIRRSVRCSKPSVEFYHTPILPPAACDEFQALPAVVSLDCHFSILHVNIRGWLSHSSELEVRLTLLEQLPSIICVNETKLVKSLTSISLTGYTLVSRRDFGNEQHAGGVAVFALDEFADHCVFLEHSPSAERSWHLLHSTLGPILLSAWYRRPDPGEIDTIISFEAEWAQLHSQAIGSIIIGDLNLHHPYWLRYSSRTSREGSLMYAFCREHGLSELVRKPTHGAGHLLDLILTDMKLSTLIKVLPEINIDDHNLILATFGFEVNQRAPVAAREVWDFSRADWLGLNNLFSSNDWSWIYRSCPNENAQRLTDLSLVPPAISFLIVSSPSLKARTLGLISFAPS